MSQKQQTFHDDPNHVISVEWRRVLEYQVKLFADKEISFLERYGFDESKGPLLDLGCGIGLFAKAVSKRFPKLKIIAKPYRRFSIRMFR